MRIVETGIAYHVGLVRQANQDSLAKFERPSHGTFLVIADGMGGHNGGQLASGRAVATLGHWFQQEGLATWFAQLTATERGKAMTRLLHQNVLDINDQLVKWSQQKPELARMGTTLTAMWLYADQLAIAHVGDSRAMVWRRGSLFPLTQEHSWVAEQVRLGLLSTAAAQHHPHRNRLLRAVGTDLALTVDHHLYTLLPEDILVMCSDGVSAYVSDEELATVILTHSGTNLQTAADALLQTIFTRGARDNVSLILARVATIAEHPRSATALIRRDMTPEYEQDIATIIEPLRTSLPSKTTTLWRVALLGLTFAVGVALTASFLWYYADFFYGMPKLPYLLLAISIGVAVIGAATYGVNVWFERLVLRKDNTYA